LLGGEKDIAEGMAEESSSAKLSFAFHARHFEEVKLLFGSPDKVFYPRNVSAWYFLRFLMEFI